MMSLTAVQIGELTAQFFLAAAGTLSFAILFACPRRCLPYCALVGAVGWLWYELLTLLGADAATASLLAVIPLTILTRVFAITQKTPVTVFLLTGIFPLVPGAGIYYTAYYFIQNNIHLLHLKAAYHKINGCCLSCTRTAGNNYYTFGKGLFHSLFL